MVLPEVGSMAEVLLVDQVGFQPLHHSVQLPHKATVDFGRQEGCVMANESEVEVVICQQSLLVRLYPAQTGTRLLGYGLQVDMS